MCCLRFGPALCTAPFAATKLVFRTPDDTALDSGKIGHSASEPFDDLDQESLKGIRRRFLLKMGNFFVVCLFVVHQKKR